MQKSQKTKTNGEMILAMFPSAFKDNFIVSDANMADYIMIHLGDYEMRVSYDWWYLPYREDANNDSRRDYKRTH